LKQHKGLLSTDSKRFTNEEKEVTELIYIFDRYLQRPVASPAFLSCAKTFFKEAYKEGKCYSTVETILRDWELDLCELFRSKYKEGQMIQEDEEKLLEMQDEKDAKSIEIEQLAAF
jgi:hypothetical protein